MSELSAEPASSVPLRAARGAVILIAQGVGVRALSAAAGVVLARLLSPAHFGVYAIVAFSSALLSVMGDAGLGAALIQQEESPSRAELTTVFSVQTALSLLVLAAGFAASAPVAAVYHLGTSGEWLIRVMVLCFPITMLRAIPSLLLERELRFGKLTVVETCEAAGFQLAAVILALGGAGVWSFVCGSIFASTLGAVAAFAVAPWRPGFGWSGPAARRLLRFGLPYQAQGTLSFAKDSMTPTVIALVAGATAVGYVNWAFSLAAVPLLITNSLWRVTFPAFSRVQGDLELLKSMIERTVRLTGIVFLPISFLLMVSAPRLVEYVYTSKWEPALPLFYMFAVSLWSGPLVGSTFVSAFNATGRSRVALAFTIGYGILDWGLGVPLVLLMGYNGIGVRTLLVAYGTLPLLIAAMNRIVRVRVFRQLARSGPASAAAGLVTFSALHYLPDTFQYFVVAVVFGGCVYGTLISILEREILAAAMNRLLPIRVRRPLHWYLRSEDLATIS